MDIVIDFETLAISPTAAPLQLAAQVWKRDDPSHPVDNTAIASLGEAASFIMNFDLRDCIYHGLTIDPETVAWWAKRPDPQKHNVLRSGTCEPVIGVVTSFLVWLDTLQTSSTDQQITLWAQGSDFDIPILRNLLRITGYEQHFSGLVPHTQFRDARTVILEYGKTLVPEFGYEASSPSPTQVQQRAIYAYIETLNKEAGITPYAARDHEDNRDYKSLVHTAHYDCLRTILSLWTVMVCNSHNHSDYQP